MPFSDRPPTLVFPDTVWGRQRMVDTIAEEPSVQHWLGTCGDFAPTRHPVWVDSDVFRDPSIPVCDRRKRDGVRDMNWCCKCISGFPMVFLDERDQDGLKDRHVVAQL